MIQVLAELTLAAIGLQKVVPEATQAMTCMESSTRSTYLLPAETEFSS